MRALSQRVPAASGPGARRQPPEGSAVAGAPRVTFLTPHRRHTSGGVYAIEQFARGLARTSRVHLVVQKGPPGELPGVTVSASGALMPQDLPEADFLIVPADTPDGDRLYSLPARAGRPVLLFQGYGAPGNPVVSANLARADQVIAVSHWLVEAARAQGCRAVHVPYGVDRDLFWPGEPAPQRPPAVAMLVHRVAWKGTAEGLAALRLVRQAVPEVVIRLFGESQPFEGVSFLQAPDRSTVADLLRQTAVYVCPSWEEGFGMPGLEALACGAALATTDTKGSRDYALPGHTALVSRPLDVEALADHTVRLLRDTALRGDLARAGQAYVAERYRSWPEACTRLSAVLAETG